MAFKHVSHVLDSYLPAPEKLVMAALAESASKEDDCCWLSLPTIAQRASCTRRGAQKILLRLKELGLVEIAGKRKVARGFVNIFRIHCDRLPMDMPDELRGEPDSPVEGEGAESRATSTGERASPLTGEHGSPLATGEREDAWRELGSRVHANQSALTREPGSPNPILKNQVLDSGPGRSGPGSGPGRTPTNPEMSADERAARSAAHRLGIDQRRYGETLEQFERRIGEAQLAQTSRMRAEREATAADVPRETSPAKAAPLSDFAVEQFA